MLPRSNMKLHFIRLVYPSIVHSLARLLVLSPPPSHDFWIAFDSILPQKFTRNTSLRWTYECNAKILKIKLISKRNSMLACLILEWNVTSFDLFFFFWQAFSLIYNDNFWCNNGLKVFDCSFFPPFFFSFCVRSTKIALLVIWMKEMASLL